MRADRFVATIRARLGRTASRALFPHAKRLAGNSWPPSRHGFGVLVNYALDPIELTNQFLRFPRVRQLTRGNFSFLRIRVGHAFWFACSAFRALRGSGATPTQTKVGIRLGLGKPKSVIADEFGIQLSSVMATTKKLYQNLDVHNSAELATKIWLDQKRNEARQDLRRAG
jgi:hypothetical protein